MTRAFLAAATAAALASTFVPADAGAQLIDRVKRRAQQQVERRVEDRTAQAVDKGMNTVECAATDAACIRKAQADGKTVVAPGTANGAAAPAAAGAPGVAGEGVWANYDFVPGPTVLFADDFARDRVGDFPRRLEFLEGNAELVEWQGRRFVRATDGSAFQVALPSVLPDRFTLEFDVHTPNPQNGVSVGFGEIPNNDWRQYTAEYISVGHWSGSGVKKGGNDISVTPDERAKTEVVRTRVMADGPYVKVYLNERRVANFPRAALGRTNKVTFHLSAHQDSPVYVSDIRIAAGGRDLYEALSADGRVATQGILFDTGSDVLRPESTPTLKEIADMLAQHGDLKLSIEGHTDNVGQAAANKTLSERRAAAVKAYLVSRHGIAADRLQTAGHGDAKPAAPNTTPEGRTQNRRVELVKM